jgi:hypothetical protein
MHQKALSRRHRIAHSHCAHIRPHSFKRLRHISSVEHDLEITVDHLLGKIDPSTNLPCSQQSHKFCGISVPKHASAQHNTDARGTSVSSDQPSWWATRLNLTAA